MFEVKSLTLVCLVDSSSISFLLKLLQRGLPSTYLMRKAKVTVYKAVNLLVSPSFHLSQRIMLDYVWQFLLTRSAPSSYLRSYKIIFHSKFLILTVEIGQNRNEISNVKIITNLLTEYYSHLKGYLRENYLRRPLHNNIMITKVGEEGAFTDTAPKLLRASHNNYLIAKHEGYHMFTP